MFGGYLKMTSAMFHKETSNVAQLASGKTRSDQFAGTSRILFQQLVCRKQPTLSFDLVSTPKRRAMAIDEENVANPARYEG